MPRARKNSRDNSPEESSEASDLLEKKLDQLVIQVIERATRKVKNQSVEPISVQINALKIASAYWAVKRRLLPPEDTEGSAWNALHSQLAQAVDGESDDSEDSENEEEDEKDDEENSLSERILNGPSHPIAGH